MKYCVESDIGWGGSPVPCVVKRSDTGDALCTVTTPDATAEEVFLIAFILNGKAHDRYVGVSTPHDDNGGYSHMIWSDEQEGHTFQRMCEAGEVVDE
jgi:hypothetical protein